MRVRTLLTLIAISATCLPATAGTGSLYSPAGLPQSSNQTYTVPSPQVQGTTVTFPTPPIPLGGALQDFPNSGLPVPGTATNPQPNTTQVPTNIENFQPPSTEAGNIDSFFQCGPADTAPKKTPVPVKIVKTPGKVLWHVLDNLGVPMFVGKDNDLDPSLTHTRFIPPKSATTGTNTDIPEKIPESELEGPEVLPNDQNQVSPR